LKVSAGLAGIGGGQGIALAIETVA